MSELSIEEKKVIDKLKKSIPALSNEEKERVLIFSEAVAMLAERKQEKPH